MLHKYFTDCRTAEDVKATYKDLVKRLHPDNNPGNDTTALFQAMQAEYKEAFERLKTVHVNAEGEMYEKATDETAEEYMDILDKLFKVPGIVIELCGSWLWITGNTKECKDLLKELKFKWAGHKAAWYYHRDPWHKRGSSKMSLDDIRSKYGSTRFTGAGRGYKPDADPEALPV